MKTEQDVLDDVESLLRSRPSVDDVHAVRSQRTMARDTHDAYAMRHTTCSNGARFERCVGDDAES